MPLYVCNVCNNEIKIMIFREPNGTCCVNCQKVKEAKDEGRKEGRKARRPVRARGA